MATRFYLPSTGTPDISPTFNTTSWPTVTNADRISMVTTRISSAMTSKDGVGNAATTRQLLRQYISGALAAQTLSGTIKGQMRMNSNVSNVGMGALAFRLCKVTADGATITEIIAANQASDATSGVPPATNGTGLVNRRLENPPANTFSITIPSTGINAGERLLFESGYLDNTTNTGRFCSISYGDNSASDLPEDESTTTADNPWIEFSVTVTLSSGQTLTADPGAVAITGVAATLIRAAKIVASAGSYLLTGTVAGLLQGHRLTADAGSVSIAGTLAALRAGFLVGAAAGSVALSGTAAGLTTARTVGALAGSYAVTGQTANLRTTRLLSAASGAVAITGTNAALDAGSVITIVAEPGAVAISGTAAGLSITAHRTAADAGAVAVTGTAAGLHVGHRVVADSTLIALSGQTAAIKAGYRLVTSDVSAVDLDGTDVGLLRSRVIEADAGAVAVSGQAAALVYSSAASEPTFFLSELDIVPAMTLTNITIVAQG